MVRFFHARFFSSSRKPSTIVLAFVLCVGYFLGAVLALLSDQFSVSLMHTAVLSRGSIVSILSVLLLPFLFTAFAVFVRRYQLLVPIAFFRAVIFSYVCSVIVCIYGSSGWLILLLFLFSDCASLPVLCWLWVRSISSREQKLLRNIFYVFVPLLGIVYLDYRFVSPFLVMLLS